MWTNIFMALRCVPCLLSSPRSMNVTVNFDGQNEASQPSTVNSEVYLKQQLVHPEA